ncbi:conserved hypothetical protein [Tenacibaculum sp. 190524A02b]|uniref:XRE family transcriptional regulator n=1 Tax=Tenacibaculum vairaonense TaxID=3137860 RepID=A0ABP1F6Q9_9FLAO
MYNSPHIGKLLSSYIEKNAILNKSIASFLKVSTSQIYRYKRSPRTSTGSLWKICHALKHNFFMDIALLLPESYHSKTSFAKDDEIKRLTEENKKLTIEINVLKELLKK